MQRNAGPSAPPKPEPSAHSAEVAEADRGASTRRDWTRRDSTRETMSPDDTPHANRAQTEARSQLAESRLHEAVTFARGPIVGTDSSSAWLEAFTPARVGRSIHLRAVLEAVAPFHINPEYPHRFTLNPLPPGVDARSRVVRGMRATQGRGVFDVPVRATRAGNFALSGTLSFSVCTEERCRIESQAVTITVDALE